MTVFRVNILDIRHLCDIREVDKQVVMRKLHRPWHILLDLECEKRVCTACEKMLIVLPNLPMPDIGKFAADHL